MNQRIEKLAEQAMAKAVAKNFTGEKLELRMPSEVWAKEFAELIVRECAKLVDDHDPTGIIEGIVLQHFGVEE